MPTDHSERPNSPHPIFRVEVEQAAFDHGFRKGNGVKKYGEYRTRRLVLAAYDDMMAQGMRSRTEGYR